MTEFELPQRAQDLLSDLDMVEFKAEEIRHGIGELTRQAAQDLERLDREHEIVDGLIENRTNAYELVASVWADYERARTNMEAGELEAKQRPAPKAAEALRAKGRELAEARRQTKLAEYIVELYEWHFPWLTELRADGADESYLREGGRTADEAEDDPVSDWLTAEEFRSLPSAERNQRALDRYLRSNATRIKYVTALNAIFKRARRVWKLETNPAAGLERPRVRNQKSIQVYSPEEVWALARAANEQDAATYLVAAFCGLRMGELLALAWRDVDFPNRVIRVRASYTQFKLDTPKSSAMRAVPMADPVARALAQLSQREHFIGDDDLVFPNHAGDHQNPKQLRKRYRAAQKSAGLRALSFHDLRHTFGTLAINRADPVQVQHWMGHAHLSTTMRYLHFRKRDDEADLLSGVFEPELGPEIGPQERTSETN
jgi:integrase